VRKELLEQPELRLPPTLGIGVREQAVRVKRVAQRAVIVAVEASVGFS